MRKFLVAGNWKMHGSRASVAALVEGLLEQGTMPCQTLICPPVIFFDQLQRQLVGSSIGLGAQNLDWHDSGAYTGEVSAAMVLEFGCSHVLVGHSERRSLFGESDAQVGLKVEKCLSSGLTPVICIGESLAQRQADETFAVVQRQLDAVIRQVGVTALRHSIIAYEPVWAIGTGESATPEQAERVHAQIRQYLAKQDESLSQNIQLLYGGSVNGENAADLFAQENIDGALVGGASLKVDDFLRICRAAV
ncbi:MAG: triose-phosphate isomerase [SAR86 cluster bacterium]|uniref:Triosephosphate isomerase n=1 Tax=SAR86 cluster bacterium TaxID=2030880 RepID=A0A972VWA8_9GAMM|nr:triose-phosphate isomerase [SAR86 cluster bacterium]